MKKVKKVWLLTVLLLISVLATSQVVNIMSFPIERIGVNGKFIDTFSFDIDTAIDQNIINARLADSIINWWPENSIQDTTTNYRLFVYEFGVRWSAAEIRDMIQGKYADYLHNENKYDSIKVAMVELHNGSYYVYKKYQYEAILRYSKKIDGAMSEKVGELCIAKLKILGEPKFYYGYLQPEYSAANNTAYLMRDTLSGIARKVEYHTVAKYTNKLAEHYQKAND